MHLRRSTLGELTRPDAFQWLAGIEDTFITAPSPKTGRTLDEYELTEHYARWKEDVELFASLGLRSVRYGIPWHRIQPARGRWDFSSVDGPVERMLELGIAPVVDLIHYGLPPWIDGAWLDPDLPELAAEYAARVADRFRGRVHTYTPLNEPRITAWYCGKLGWWPPARRGWRGFTAVTLAVSRTIARIARSLAEVDPEIVCVHVDATDLYDAETPDLAAEAAHRQEIVFLALDLVSGRVGETHPLLPWLLRHGGTARDIDWFATHAVALDVVGINLYPLFSQKLLLRRRGRLRIRMPYAGAAIVERLAELYWNRYGRPLVISETASMGAIRRRRLWLEDSVRAVRRTRERGIPLVGYTWWPLFSLVTWGYREGRKPAAEYLRQMGLWDLVLTDSGLERVPTSLADRYRELVAGGFAEAGRLADGPR